MLVLAIAIIEARILSLFTVKAIAIRIVVDVYEIE